MAATQRPRQTAAHLLSTVGPLPFTSVQAGQHGVTRGALQAALAAGTLTRLRQGVLIVSVALTGLAETELHQLRARAAQLVMHDSVLSHETALLLHNLPTPLPNQRIPQRPILTVPRRGGQSDDVRRVTSSLAATDVVEVRGWPTTTVARTAIDVARGLPLPQALVVLDAASRAIVAALRPGARLDRILADTYERARGCKPLAEALERSDNPRHHTALAYAVKLADPRSESGMESWSRAVIQLAGLPVPELQPWVRGDNGCWYRSDFGWKGSRVLGEADGMVKYDDIRAVRVEKQRQDALTRAGWTIVRWTWQELTRNPDLVAARLRHALASSVAA
jgi:hypothetical protein